MLESAWDGSHRSRRRSRPATTAALLATATIVLATRAALAGDVVFSTANDVSTTASGVAALALADLDGDGDRDILAANSTDGAVVWHASDGAGAFGLPQTVSGTVPGASFVAAADLDGDGDLDVLAAAPTVGSVGWHENAAGDGSAWSPHAVANGAAGAADAAAADLDRDGDLDVVFAASGAGTVSWAANDGGGTFAALAPIGGALAGARAVAAGDVDGDGDLDVAAGGTTTLSSFANVAGNGSTWSTTVLDGAAGGVRDLALADVDRDGDLDVVGAAEGADRVTWWANEGSGLSFTPTEITASADGVAALSLADVDFDGDLDVLTASALDDTLAWHENTGLGAGWTARVVSNAVAGAAAALAVDVDRDGDVDLLAGAPGTGTIAWHGNLTIHRRAAFVAPATSVVTSSANGAVSVALADVDGDGRLDLLSASLFDDTVAWYRNAGAGNYSGEIVVTTTADGASDVAAADLDRDGDLDAVFCSVFDDRVAWSANADGAGTFAAPIVLSTSGDMPWSVTVGDLDGDGDPDVVSASSLDHEIAWLANDGTGGFAPATLVTALAVGVQSVAANDLDGDGDLDLLAALQGGDAVRWWENDGGAGFAATHDVSTATDAPFDAQATDLDADGDLDVLAVFLFENVVAWFERLGDGTFGPRSDLSTTAAGASSVTAADLDGDGDTDVLATSEFDDTVGWWENDGAAAFGPRQIVSQAGDAPWSAAVGDVDGDGDPDVVAASVADDTLAWFENRGGQFGVTATDTAPVFLLDGTSNDVLRLRVEHHGRPGDGDLSFAGGVDVVLLKGFAGAAFVNTNGNALFDSLSLWRDDGSGTFEEGADALLSTVGTLTLVNGVETIPIPSGTPATVVGAASAATFFVVTKMTPNASAQTPHTYRVTYLGASAAATDALGLPLIGEPVPDITSSTPTAIPSPWTDLGNALAGTAGKLPELEGQGIPAAGETVSLSLTDALPNATAALVIGPYNIDAPFAGGIFVPAPFYILFFGTNGDGELFASTVWPPGNSTGLTYFFQYWIFDPGGPQGFAASNALRVVGP